MKGNFGTLIAAAALLAAIAHAVPGTTEDSGEAFAYHELPRISAASPFHADCNGPRFPITAAYVNAESEPYVAVNPLHPDNLIAVYHEDRYPNDGANGVLAATSFDGGRAWQVPDLRKQPAFSRCAGGDAANGGDFEKASDPWVTFGADGTAYFAAVSWNASDPEVAQLVAASRDGGRTWERPVTVVRSHDPDVSDASRPVLAADPLHPHAAYLVWARQRSAPASAARGSVVFSRTTDSGRTWSAAREIYRTPPGMQTSANQIVVLPDGNLLNVFNELPADAGSVHPRHDRIALMRSSDGGSTWSQPATLATSDVVEVVDPRTGTKVRTGDSFTGVAVDPRPGTGTVYAVWADARFTHGQTQQIVLAKSTDGGRTWGAPAAVAPEPGIQQFIPGVAVNDRGEVAVAWYGFAAARSATPGLMTRYWLAWSTDQGRTWSARKPVTSRPFDFRTVVFNAGLFVGEYQGLAGAGHAFVAAVTLANGHNLDNRTDIYACTVNPDVPLRTGADTVCAAPAARPGN